MPIAAKHYFILFLLPLLLIYAGCAPKKKIPPSPVPEKPEKISPDAADNAWEKEDYAASADLYRKLLQRPQVPKKKKSRYRFRLAFSLTNLGKCNSALGVLRKWSNEIPQARFTWRWQKLYIHCLGRTEGEKALAEHLSEISISSKYPYKLARKAAEKLIRIYWEKKEYAKALPVYAELFSRTEKREEKTHLQKQIHSRLNGLALQELDKLEKKTRQIKRPLKFPYNLVIWSYWIRRVQKDEKNWPKAWPHLNSVVTSRNLPHPTPFREKLARLQEKLGRVGKRIGLAIPLSGPYSSIGWKVLQGANLAQWKLAREGKNLALHILNTDGENWTEELARLKETQIFGGPMTRKNWEKIRGHGLNQENVFFTFLSRIKNEGENGWRFFTSPRDQVRQIIAPCMERLGIRRFAVLYPQEEYGRKMARIFWEEARKKGAQITGLKSYPPQEPTEWGEAVKSFLRVEDPEDPTLTPEPDFKAVFIPDSFSRAKAIVPQFFFYDEERLLFLGPMLWSQGKMETNLENNYFSLALTTGAWWPENPSPSKQNLSELLDLTMQGNADFWTALGYDFIRHCQRLPSLGLNPAPEKIDKEIATLPPMQWTMAPIMWDKSGAAKQNLYVLRISDSGFKPAHFPSIEALMLYRQKQHMQKIKKLEKEKESNGEKKAPEKDKKD